MKKVFQRTCIGCNKKKNKNELIRIVKNKNGEICLDTTGKMQGRGAYICNDAQCLEIALKKKKIERSFSNKVNDIVYENLRGVISDRNSNKEQKDENN